MEKALRIKSSLAFRQRQEPRAHLHSRGNVTEDVLGLLSTARQRGFSSLRSSILIERISQPGLSASRIRKIETSLRAWIRRHEL
jgi:hypothetical protein